MSRDCDDTRIYAGNSWFLFIAARNPDTGELITSGAKPTATYSANGGAETAIADASVVWGNYGADTYLQTGGTPIWPLRILVPGVPEGWVTVRVTFANPAHTLTVEKEIW